MPKFERLHETKDLSAFPHRQKEPRFTSHGKAGGPLGDGVATTICPPKAQPCDAKGDLPRLPRFSRTYSVVQSLPATAQASARGRPIRRASSPNGSCSETPRHLFVQPAIQAGLRPRSSVLVPNSLRDSPASRKGFPPGGLPPCGQVPRRPMAGLSGVRPPAEFQFNDSPRLRHQWLRAQIRFVSRLQPDQYRLHKYSYYRPANSQRPGFA
jgi:hypothetical protein